MPTQRCKEKRERMCACAGEKDPWPFDSSFCVFSPLGLPYVNWASQECYLFYLRSSLQSSDLPFTLLCSIFADFSLPYLLATDILASYFLF